MAAAVTAGPHSTATATANERWSLPECRHHMVFGGGRSRLSWLSDVPMIKAIAITQALLGRVEIPLRIDIGIVATSSADSRFSCSSGSVRVPAAYSSRPGRSAGVVLPP